MIFVAAAAAIWLAGTKLSDSTDILDERLHLGAALGGTIILAVATNLPEIAITASAAMQHAIALAVGNILGGIAIQTLLLVALEAFGVRARKPLTYQAASLTLVLESALAIAVLVVTVMETQLPSHLYYLRLTPSSILILLLWLGGCCSCHAPSVDFPGRSLVRHRTISDLQRGTCRYRRRSRQPRRGRRPPARPLRHLPHRARGTAHGGVCRRLGVSTLPQHPAHGAGLRRSSHPVRHRARRTHCARPRLTGAPSAVTVVPWFKVAGIRGPGSAVSDGDRRPHRQPGQWF